MPPRLTSFLCGVAAFTLIPTLTNPPTSHPAELVTSTSRLVALARSLRKQPAVAFDLESNGLHRYPEHICLVQLATESESYILDPLAIGDMAALGELLQDANVEKIFHSADYDLRSLDRDWGFRVASLYDTSIAAHFTGIDHLGLATVLELALGIKVEKDRRLQRADWTMRPLSARALDYAAADVAYLIPLRRRLAQALDAEGRTEWAEEECARLARIEYSPPDSPEDAVFSMKGARALHGRELAVLRELLLLRDQEARRRNRPPYQVLSNDTLLALASNPDADLAEVPGVTRLVIARLGPAIRAALRKGKAAPPVDRPPREAPFQPRPTAAETQRLQQLKTWRTAEAEFLKLDAALIWPMASLERLAREPASIQRERDAPEVRVWQRRRFADSLRAMLEQPLTAPASPKPPTSA